MLLMAVLRESVVRGQKNPLHYALPLRLKQALRLSGLTRTGLAQRAGISHPVVSSLEARKSLTTVGIVAQLASALGVSASWLSFGIGDRSPTEDASCDGMGERLKAMRILRGHTRTALARLAQVSPGTVSHIEEGGQAKVNTLESLAQALGVSPGWLAFGVGPQVLCAPRRGRPPAQSSTPVG